MAHSSQPPLRFACPLCGARLKTPAALAGTRHHCPACRGAIDVPGKRAPQPSAKRRPLRPGITYIPVVCDRCQTRMYAIEEEVGGALTCPDCGTRSTVVRPKEEPAAKKAWEPVEVDEDEYQLCEGVDQPQAGSRAFQQYIAVICPVCSTRMLATEDQVGQRLVCPDCTVATTVPPPEPPGTKPSPPVVVVGEDEYRVHEGVDQPPPGESYVPIVCNVCGTRLYAPLDQVGHKITCPDCHTRHVVPPPGPDAKRHDPMTDSDGTYRVGEAIEPPDIRVGVDYREQSRTGDDRPDDRAVSDGSDPEAPPPRWTFFSGVFNFPFYAGSLGCWIGLTLGALVVIGLMAAAVALSEIESEATWVASMVLSGLTFVALTIWIVVASAYLLAVIRDTANGADQIENWPGAVFLDWMGDSYFVFSSLAFGLLPGLAARHIFLLAGWEHVWCVPVGMLLAFPLLLVSMLETDSPLKPISLPVLGTLWTAWWAWGLFYLQSTLLLAAALFLADALAMLIGLWALPLTAPLLVAAIMIYCRLLGRLVWYSSRAAEETPSTP